MTRSPLIEAAERLSKAALVIGDTIERSEARARCAALIKLLGEGQR